jgi:UDP-glucuronate 4-epimerase
MTRLDIGADGFFILYILMEILLSPPQKQYSICYVRILVTGAAGFIGHSLSKRLLQEGCSVLAIDSMNSYYSTKLKHLRLLELFELSQKDKFIFSEVDLCDSKVESLVRDFQPDSIFHLAAQPGVRLGLAGAKEYSRNNVEAFLKILGIAVNAEVKNFLYASSSSVYGESSLIPFRENEVLLRPTSIYGVTKLSNELFTSTICGSGLKCRGLRFFSVYGPKGRPDMAYFKAIAASALHTNFYRNGTGLVARDFTFIEDVSESIILLAKELQNRPTGFRDVVNIGGGKPITINDLIDTISRKTGHPIQVVERQGIKEDLPLTRADYGYLEQLIGKDNFVDFDIGIGKTIDWMLKHKSSEIREWLG